MIKKSHFMFLKGFMTAAIIFVGTYFLFNSGIFSNPKAYVILKSDYKIADVGNLKKGTVLRIDEGMAEGFTRFILYLNLKDNDFEKYPHQEKGIIPYWLLK